MLTTTRTVRGWIVSYRHRSASPKCRQSTSFLTVPEQVRYWHDFYGSQPWNADLSVTEHTETVSVRPMDLGDLPGPGEPTPAPPVPPGAVAANRFYQIPHVSTRVLRTGDDVRAHRAWLIRSQGYAADSLGLVVDVVRTQFERTVTLAEVGA
jgi:hypothetical protein